MPTAYITAPPDAAESLAETLVEERLAACVNALDCHSTYRWEDEVHSDPEVVLLAKTTDERYDDLVARVEELHSYEEPCVERFDESDVRPSFGTWVDESVR